MNAQKFHPQEYFNWGFHDGASDVAHSRSNKWLTESHFSNEYRQGYLVGYSEAKAGRSTDDSQEAWEQAKFWGDV